MKKLLAFCLVLSLSAYAQKIQTTKGAEFALKKYKGTNVALEPDSSGFYYFRAVGGWYSTRYVIQKFDLKTSAPIFEKEIDLSGDEYIGGKGAFQKALNKNGKILVFSLAIKGKKNHFIMQEFSSATGEALTRPLVIDELDDTKAYIISDAVLEFNLSFSPDNKKMLVVSELKKDDRAQKVTAKLYDVNGYKKIWEKEPITTFANSTVSSFDYCVDNEGTLSYLFVYLRSKNESFYISGKTTYYFKDFAHGIGINRGSASYNKAIAIPSASITTFDPKLELINGNLVCTGRYLKGEHTMQNAGAHENVGFFLLTIDPVKAELKTKSFELLNDELKARLAYKDNGKYYAFTGNKSYVNYQTIWLNNCFYHIQFRAIDPSKIDCYGKEIIVFKYDAGHKLEWMRLIPRSTHKELYGMYYLVSEKINFFYYENPKNLAAFPDVKSYDPKRYKTSRSAKKSVIACASVDEKGNVTRQQLPATGENIFLDENNYKTNFLKGSNALILPVHISSTLRRYDIVSLAD